MFGYGHATSGQYQEKMTDLFSESWLQDLPGDARQRLRKVCTAVHFPRGGDVYRFGSGQDRLCDAQRGRLIDLEYGSISIAAPSKMSGVLPDQAR